MTRLSVSLGVVLVIRMIVVSPRATSSNGRSGRDRVDAITGAASSGQNFEKLVAAVLKQAAAGDAATVEVA
ncbi:MAG: hypothetical protein HFH78_00115 [Lachnospiraceae bacterium]|nr:hypothetical protein [Lachnospiraceae bacterium]